MLFPMPIVYRMWLGIVVTIPAVLMISPRESRAQNTLRVATFNASLYGKSAGEIRTRLQDGIDPQAEKVAAIVQTVRPDVLVINEIDYDAGGVTAKLLAEKFFARVRSGRDPIEYPYIFAAPSNTGIDSQLDLNGNGQLGEPQDAWGYGVYPGQYSMAVYSRFPIDRQGIRTFQRYLWKEMPDALRPIDTTTKQPYHEQRVWDRMRLSSKNHVDVPIVIEKQRLHILASHPTPPVFDGAEDRNGCRNHDEIRLWVDYLAGPSSMHLVDDHGHVGGLPQGELFVIAGDLNSDPTDGASRRRAIRSLLEQTRLHDPTPTSLGALEAANDEPGPAETDTASFGPVGNMRVDYVLPSRQLNVRGAGVFWPRRSDAAYELISASDHRMVWIEVEMP